MVVLVVRKEREVLHITLLSTVHFQSYFLLHRWKKAQERNEAFSLK